MNIDNSTTLDMIFSFSFNHYSAIEADNTFNWWFISNVKTCSSKKRKKKKKMSSVTNLLDVIGVNWNYFLQALEILPPELKVRQVVSFLEASVHSLMVQQHVNLIKKKMQYTAFLKVKLRFYLWLKHLSLPFLIQQTMNCWYFYAPQRESI